MKTTTTFVVALFMLCISLNVNAQRTCAAHDHMVHQLEHNPKMHEKQAELESFTKKFAKDFSQRKASETRTIPVHVIVIYANSQQNISEAQIQSQIDVLNLDYGGANSDISQTPSEFTSVTAYNTGISFIIEGIERHYNTRSEWGTNDAMKTAYPPTSPATTLNMWICNIGGGILGYAQFPGGDPSTDGVVFSPQYCGSSDYDDGSFYLSAPFDKGRTCTHEVGHYLNLRHIWGDGNCNVDDYVDDTPIAGSANYSCPSYPSKSCTNNGGWTSDMFMNYMDYVDDACMFMFSEGQSARMWACLNSTRSELGYSDGNAPPVAVANGPYSGDAGVNISFSSAGSNDPDGAISAYAWDFGDGNSSTAANPSHIYSADGVYTVSLTVTDDGGKTATATTTATIGNVCTGIQACDGAITLTLTTDRYASETSWTLKNEAGTTIESGSGYSNSTTYNIDWSLGEGTYTFTINDSYGDGICCAYGSGSYSLADGCSTFATGGDFGSSESVEFCVPAGSTPVNEEPVAVANGPYSGTEGQAVSFSSAGSYDADGSIVSYAWDFGEGGSSTSANPSYTYTSAGTYTVSLTVTDDDGATASASTSATIEPGSTGGTVELTFDTFESGWGNWSDGGSDCRLYTGSTRAYEGTSAINIQDNSGVSSSTYLSSGIDVHTPGFTSIEVEFYFYAYSMEYGEDFWVQYYDGWSWYTVAAYAQGTSFSNYSFYTSTITISETDYNFPTNMRIRFMCDASGNADDIYLDNIKITGISGTSRKNSDIYIAQIDNYRSTYVDGISDDLRIYPNPAYDMLNIELGVEDNTIVSIYNTTGQLVRKEQIFNDVSQLNISDLKAGLYYIQINNGNEVLSTKLLKK